MNILEKLQKQPERIKKIILWSVVIIVGLVLAAFWINNSYRGIKNLQPGKIIKEQWINKIESQLR